MAIGLVEGPWQDVDLMDEGAMQAAAHAEWNPCDRLPLTSWLSSTKADNHADRMTTLGNIVVPRCARLGMHLLLHAVRAEA